MLRKYLFAALFISAQVLGTVPNQPGMSITKKIVIGGTVGICVASAAILAAPVVLPAGSILAVKAAAITAAAKTTGAVVAAKAAAIATAATVPVATDTTAILLGKVSLDLSLAETAYSKARQTKECFLPTTEQKIEALETRLAQKKTLAARLNEEKEKEELEKTESSNLQN